MVLFICSEIMLFGCLFAGFFFVHQQADRWPPEGVEKVGVWLALGLTGILLSSSLVVHFGFLQMKSGKTRTFIISLLVTILLGTLFISGQIYEWFSLFDDGVTAHAKVYGSTFFLITGFHGAHVIAGLCMLWVAWIRSVNRDFTSRRYLYPEAAILYWHFVDVI